MNQFFMNGRLWRVIFTDPYAPELVDRTGEQRVATTDPMTQTVYLSRSLHGDFLRRVLSHELGHVTMISYNMLDEIHRMAHPRYWVEIEEWICNFITDYGLDNFRLVDQILQDN